MDDSVLAAIAKWPNVPHVYGWLSLDRRGKWRLQGSPISNQRASDFIGRNYECDDRGAWFFQNGPQRVYVQLDYTPWVARIGDGQLLLTHTGLTLHDMHEALLDESGNLLIAFGGSVALLDDRDLSAMLGALVDASGTAAADDLVDKALAGQTAGLRVLWNGIRIPVSNIQSAQVAQRYGFMPSPMEDI